MACYLFIIVAASISQQKPVDQSGLTSDEQKPEKCCIATTLTQQMQHQTPVLEQQSTSPGSEQHLEPGNTLCPT